MVRRLRNGKALRFKWDAFGRLSEAYTREVRTVFAYDPLGRRILKRGEPTLMDTTFFEGTQAFRNEYWRQMRERGLGATFYGWEGDRIAWESDSRGGGTLHYVFEPQGFTPVLQARASRAMMEVLLARPAEVVRSYANEAGEYELERDPLYNGAYEPGYDEAGNPPEPLTQIHYYQCDHLGTPMELTDEAGEIAWEAQYKAWGEAQVVLSEAARRAGVKNPLRFQGQYFDEETGLHYNRYRYYDPHAGRFFSKDPIGLAGGLNLQEYGRNPVEWVDPLGLATSRVSTTSRPTANTADRHPAERCDATLGANQARREALRRAGIPTSATPFAQRTASGAYTDRVPALKGMEQYAYRVKSPEGETIMVLSHHTADKNHACPHWHVGAAKDIDSAGLPATFENGAWKYRSHGPIVEHR